MPKQPLNHKKHWEVSDVPLITFPLLFLTFRSGTQKLDSMLRV